MTSENEPPRAWQSQIEDHKAEPVPQPGALPDVELPAADANDTSGIEAPPFLHEREIRDAFRAVNLLASGRNPFTEEPFEKLRMEHRDSVLQALCVLVSALCQAEQKPVQKPTFKPSPSAPADPSSKRPLEEYLQRLEREAILEALAETKGNRTAAARLLGITFRALRYRLESFGLDE